MHEAISNTEKIEPLINRLGQKGMWLSESVKMRILILAGERDEQDRG